VHTYRKVILNEKFHIDFKDLFFLKIRFNPNPGTHGWIASADKVGLFLLFRLSTSDSALSEKLTQRLQRVQVL
jgi:hypothetical protein